ncbi:hypothetical protein KGA66_26920 [Actinocrinis puniceicyclus]|uniref:Large ATP-binding protein n=1 Tax=Actinocrinis puniceicyclus TaxID=977794 RepID=A0A8J8BES7_9ACTN|nr:hypothetical protein [Actinocrinis puniceicyclus]MBS2966698.1 hypothetical protein [Actinocrinis puniceicyclus]
MTAIPNAASENVAVVPSASEILQQVADKLGLTPVEVERSLAEANITLKSPSAADRRLRVLRLRAQGVKHSGEPFAVEQAFSAGVWAIVHPDNSAGKTSLLEFLVWPLRGEPRDLPPDVRSWLRHLSLDVLVAGRPIRIAVDLDPEAHPSVTSRILAADTADELLATPDDAALRPLERASGIEETGRSIGGFFLDALRMGQTSLWQATGGADGEGAPQVHGWAAYFGACYLNPGGDDILLGDVNAVGLSARLLELFVDIPYSTVLTHLSSAGKREEKDLAQRKRRAEQDAAARVSDRDVWLSERNALSREIEELRDAARGDVTPALKAADAAAAVLRGNQAVLEAAEQAADDAKSIRVRAEQALLDARETWQARRVLGRLDPVCCPRCEEPFEQQRREQEREQAACTVCTRPLPAVHEETAEALLEGLTERLNEAKDAEIAANQNREAAADAVGTAVAEQQAALTALQNVLATSQNHERLREMELQAARLEGQLAATGAAPTSAPVPVSSQVVQAVYEVVRGVVDESAKRLFPAMNSQIVELATRFGVQNLDSVRLDRSGRVNAVKAGVRTSFKKLSRGDRLRMRIATVIALLRVSASRGMSTHPGLLLIDSVATEEVTETPARTLIAELQAIANEIPDLQVVFTTAQPELVDALPAVHLITRSGEHLF